jgi:ribosomal protein S18 acetylase RimI-like enzyme
VFGDNVTAIALYESLGYTVISQQMTKRVDGA